MRWKWLHFAAGIICAIFVRYDTLKASSRRRSGDCPAQRAGDLDWHDLQILRRGDAFCHDALDYYRFCDWYLPAALADVLAGTRLARFRAGNNRFPCIVLGHFCSEIGHFWSLLITSEFELCQRLIHSRNFLAGFGL